MSACFKHEEKKCPRCGSDFECKVGDIANCQCNAIPVTPETVALVSKNYDDCLCRDCLSELSKEVFSFTKDTPLK